MNFINERKLIKAVEKQIKRLENAQSRVKDKERWLEKNGARLASLRMVNKTVKKKILEELQRQGQSSHDDLNGSRARANQNEK